MTVVYTYPLVKNLTSHGSDDLAAPEALAFASLAVSIQLHAICMPETLGVVMSITRVIQQVRLHHMLSHIIAGSLLCHACNVQHHDTPCLGPEQPVCAS